MTASSYLFVTGLSENPTPATSLPIVVHDNGNLRVGYIKSVFLLIYGDAVVDTKRRLF